MQLSTSGGAVHVARCRAHNASINTAAQAGPGQQQQQEPAAVCSPTGGGSIQVGGRARLGTPSALTLTTAPSSSYSICSLHHKQHA